MSFYGAVDYTSWFYLCAACGEPIRGTVTLLNDKHYHPNCVPLVWGTLRPIEDRVAELERRVAELEAKR